MRQVLTANGPRQPLTEIRRHQENLSTMESLLQSGERKTQMWWPRLPLHFLFYGHTVPISCQRFVSVMLRCHDLGFKLKCWVLPSLGGEKISLDPVGKLCKTAKHFSVFFSIASCAAAVGEQTKCTMGQTRGKSLKTEDFHEGETNRGKTCSTDVVPTLFVWRLAFALKTFALEHPWFLS